MVSPAFSPLSEKLIRHNISTDISTILDDILVYPEVSSTNDVLWERFKQKDHTAAVCLAEMQSAGRGRRGNNRWESPASGNLYLSLFWPFQSKQALEGLSIVIGISVIEALKKVGIHNLQIKWPNDILFKQQKLAGILVESRYQARYYLVIGLGLNLALPPATKQIITQAVTSLDQLCDTLPDRNQLAAQLIEEMIKNIRKFEVSGLNDFLPIWSQYDALYEKDIILIDGDKKTPAIANGINQLGELQYTYNQQQFSLNNSQVSIRFAS